MRRSYYAKKPPVALVTYRINNQITAPEVRVVGTEVGNAGVMALAAALALAKEKGLDLIEVSPKAEPPVVRIGRYGQLKYEQEKRLKQQKAKQKKVEIKGIRLSLRIGVHDLEIRQGQAEKFLKDHNKVRIELPLTGRERQYKDKAKEVIQGFIQSLGENIVIEGNTEWQFGKLMVMVYQKTP